VPDEIDISSFDQDEQLGADHQVFVAIKGFNQLAIVAKIIERKGVKAYGLTATTNVANRRYSSGVIALTKLDRDSFGDHTLGTTLDCIEPYEIDVRGDSMAATSGYRFILFDLAAGRSREFTNDWMSYLHTIEFSAGGDRILTAATGLDTILEVDLDSGDILWEWNAWDHGIQHVTLTGSYLTRDPADADRLAAENPEAEIRLIDDPSKLPREGLATHHSPMNLNGTHYGRNGQILATGYHRPELFVIERDGSHERFDLGLVNPHSFRPHAGGYMVASTGAGQLLLLDDGFKLATTVDFSQLPADEEKKAGFGEWIQTVTPLGDQLFAAVDALRDGVHIFDLESRRRRFITNPPEWTIQAVIGAPIEPDRFPSRDRKH
jgi:hypothetical protein